LRIDATAQMEYGACSGRDVNVVSYTGSLASREVVQAHELWLQPTSMDGRSATTQSREKLPDKVGQKPPASVQAKHYPEVDVCT
jgi:hypothetical protein